MGQRRAARTPTDGREALPPAGPPPAAAGAMGPAGAGAGSGTAKRVVLGMDLTGLETPELVAIAVIYFVQGILGLSRIALSFFLKDELKLGPAEVSFLMSANFIPWMIKPVYGFLSDAVPLFGYKRRSYLALSGLTGALAWGALGTLGVDTASGVFALLVLGAVGTACSDVVIDSIVVERTRGASQDTAGSLQSLCWLSAAVGGIASAYFSGSLVETYGAQGVFLITGAFPLVTMVTAFMIAEERTGPGRRDGAALANQLRAQTANLWDAVKMPAILWPSVFIFCWNGTPAPSSAMFFFQTNELGFTPEFLGRVSLVAAVAKLGGVGIFNFFLKDKPLEQVFKWGALSATGLGLTQMLLVTGMNRQLGINDELFVLGDSAILEAISQVCWMPVLVFAAQVCPEGVEATLFATLMSILNSGGFVGTQVGALLTDQLGVTSDNFTHLPLLVLICTLSTPLPLLLLPQVRKYSGKAGAAAAKGE